MSPTRCVNVELCDCVVSIDAESVQRILVPVLAERQTVVSSSLPSRQCGLASQTSVRPMHSPELQQQSNKNLRVMHRARASARTETMTVVDPLSEVPVIQHRYHAEEIN
jgi:hypothetical protein